VEAWIGFLIAVAVGMTGMGGGALAAPILIRFAGMPAAEAVGTSLLFVTVIKAIAAPVYILRRQVDWRVLMRLLAGGLPGVLLGSLLLTRLSKNSLEPLVLSLVGFTIVVIALVTLARMFRSASGQTGTDKPRLLPALAFPIGLEVGFSSAGAGALGSLTLMHFTSLSAAAIVGTDMMFGWSVALAGGGMHLAFGEVNGPAVAKLLAGGVAGALCGSWLGTWMPARPLRVALTAFLVFLGSQLLWKGIESLSVYSFTVLR
jgi:uncharacterized membrane protein YfcA